MPIIIIGADSWLMAPNQPCIRGDTQLTESRKQNRRKAKAYLNVFDRNSQQFIGHVVDMTIEGVKLSSVREFDVNSVFQFIVDLPFEVSNSTEIRFDAKCVWCGKGESAQEYQAGFELQDVSVEESGRINALLNNSIFVDSTELLSVTIAKAESPTD